MNEYGEFRLNEISGINEKIDYIRINDTKYSNLKYEQLLTILIQAAIESNKGDALEAARLVKFTGGSENKDNPEYKGYTYIIPGRNQQKIEKVIKVLKIAYESPDIVFVKFKRDSQDISEEQLLKREQQYKKKLDDEKYFIAQQLFNIDEEISDEDLRKEIIADGEDANTMIWRLDHLDKERENRLYWRMERVYIHIKWVLNDSKQAELFNVSLFEYITKFKDKNIQSDEQTKLFLNYVHTMQENLNSGYIIEDFVYDNGHEEISFD